MAVTEHVPGSPRVRVIEPTKVRTRTFRDLWEYRDLLLILARRDVAVRYKQAVFGFAWAVLQPLAFVVVFTFLRRAVDVPSEGVPYPVFALGGLVPWLFFSNAVSGSSQSLVGSSNLVSKVYFPRIIIPLAALGAWLIDLAVGLVLLGILMAAYGVVPPLAALWSPVFLVLGILAALSVAVWVSALNVAYRDLRYAVPFLIQIWLFVSPVLYPSSIVGGPVRFLYGLNPMAGPIEGLRWSLLGTTAPHWDIVAVSVGVIGVLLVTGLRYFRRVEQYFADII